MEFEDKVTITTAEGVTLELPLAGIGSRAIAAFVDHALKALLTLAVVAALAGGTALFDMGDSAGDDGFLVAIAIAFVAIFLINFGYDVLFETLASGRTPGKRWTGLRVVRNGGGPVSFIPSAVRNLVRLVDLLPGAYAVGLIAVVVSSKNQRLGDMAAGTLVVRERQAKTPGVPAWAATPVRAEPPAAIDVSAITGEELATIRSFLQRRATLTPDARSKLAWELAERLRPRVGGVSGQEHPEIFLEQIAAAKAATG
jgi:uncharacterized RDD family membrane protein YckC